MHPAIELLARNLGSRDTLRPGELQTLGALQLTVATFDRGTEFIPEGSRPQASCLLYGGLAARAVSRPTGTRQLTALHIAGDFVDLHGLTLRSMDHGVIALTDCHVVFVDHADLRVITEREPHLTRLLWMLTTIDAAIQRRMTALIGRHTPFERLGHLLCEIYLRLANVGLARDGRFRFPVTQAILADILGLSLVHTNRTVRDLRESGLATWEQFDVTLIDLDGLARKVGFDPTYLSISLEPR